MAFSNCLRLLNHVQEDHAHWQLQLNFAFSCSETWIDPFPIKAVIQRYP